MKNDAWLERWEVGRTGWHEPGGNRNLQRHWEWSGKRVLVPLCGKTPDLLWLEQAGNDVVGVELSGIAVREFFAENGIEYELLSGGLPHYRAIDRRISIYCGDYFEFEAEPFDAHYDRGGLVALSPELRTRYARHTSSLLEQEARQFVITVEYDQAVCDGPPYSIGANEMLGHWPRLRRHASVDDTANAPPKFLEAGLELMHEVVWRTD
ncbi:MAG: thiopurine S-methyltransferase [Gammaproteobacteria bacterium]|nr:thiopurine S-methyltransferase [Gammaproteobacteria bacterium]MDH5618379.1 thiopurine S-methyltransferase [Gammaproteobacteria bacterium]